MDFKILQCAHFEQECWESTLNGIASDNFACFLILKKSIALALAWVL